MNARERVEAAINFRKPDRPPFNFWLDRRRMRELDDKHGCDFRLDVCEVDVIENMLFPPFCRGEFQESNGTHWMVSEAFELWEETPDIPMPDPDDPALYAPLHENLERYPDRAHLANIPNVLTAIENMRRQENFFTDMLLYPELVSQFFHRMSNVMARIAENACRLDVTAIYVQDDVACNKGLMMSMPQFRDTVLPHWKKVIDVAHRHDKPVFFHTDGRVEDLYEVFAGELGVRMLNPLQPNLQSVEAFKRGYHGRMGVYGGLDTARIHTFSTDEVRAHVHKLFVEAGADGGLVISSHDIDYTVSEDALLALAETVKECRY